MIRTIISLFRPTRNVASIMAGFHKQIGQLEALNEQKLKDASAKHDEAAALRGRAKDRSRSAMDDEMEASRADNMAGKLRDFVGQ